MLLSFPAPPSVLRLDEPIEGFHWYIQYEVTGYPLPDVTWLKDGLPLVQIDDIIYDSARSVTSRYKTSIKGSLVVTIVSHVNNGNYTLVAENTWGRAQKTISAIFLDFPPGNCHHQSVAWSASLFCIYVLLTRPLFQLTQSGRNQSSTQVYHSSIQLTADSVVILRLCFERQFCYLKGGCRHALWRFPRVL